MRPTLPEAAGPAVGRFSGKSESKAAVKCQSNALFILSGIVLTTAPKQPPSAAGGSHLVRDPWNLDEGTLEPAVYRYRIPDHS